MMGLIPIERLKVWLQITVLLRSEMDTYAFIKVYSVRMGICATIFED